MTAGDGQRELSAFRLEVAELFFALPASKGFLLAGGAALLAQHLTARPTEDLDFLYCPRARPCPRRVRRPGGCGAPERLDHGADP
jgi:hypothetical protein